MKDLSIVSPLAHYSRFCPDEQSVSLTLTQAEMCALLQAYDYGLMRIGDDCREQISYVIAKLKDQIHP